MTGREKQFWLLDLINKRVKKEMTVQEIFEQFKKELEKEKIPFSVFRYSIQVLINEKRIESRKTKVNNGSRGLSILISPIKKQNGKQVTGNTISE